MPAAFHIDAAARRIFSWGWGDMVDDDLYGHVKHLAGDPRFDPGMSGGPVFDRSGCVVGVVCSSFEGPTDADGYVSYASLLAPAFALNAKDLTQTGSSSVAASSLLDLALPPVRAIRANLAQLSALEVHAAQDRRTLLAYPRATDEMPYWSRFDPDLRP